LAKLSLAQTDSNRAQPADTEGRVTRIDTPKRIIKRRVFTDTLRRRHILDSIKRVDSTRIRDSITALTNDSFQTRRTDTIKVAAKPIVIKKPFDSIYRKLLDNPFLRTKAKPIYFVIKERTRESKDEVFYLVLSMLLFLAFIKLVFSKYFKNIFRLFFQPSFRQKQTREQLQQNSLPSLLLNLFFIISGAAYITFLLSYYRLSDIGFWYLLAYSGIALLVLYVGKYVLLSFVGWVFNAKEATNTYIFAVYLINKILGVILVPFTLILAFSQPAIINISITISLMLVLLLFFYRYIVSYGPVRREVNVSPLHFFFYVLAFEITPLLLIYKTLMIYLNKSS
jgi:hypothetical protein